MKVKDLMKILGPLELTLGDYDVYYRPVNGGIENINSVCIDSEKQEIRLL